ncbi:response regulator [Microcoleus sp. FACHB-672]|uniref:hybrid sensor histidine kinase/response regulator n=1 Tax=Microcoleus sp. FACHB-672 TaxID=2692825 RepID=UPI00168680D9|nr:response regulator [Microcoleus sp. FACHB-672]MBD2043922.1 response regulator [Microcoleus sp. FACHB-672]
MSADSSNFGPILIVDDNPTNLQLLFDCLTTAGYKVWVARSGQSAIKKVEYSPPDLILLDVLMPGIDGFETCRHLKASESTKDIPVIFMTALADTENKVKGFSVGAVDYITKPFQQEEVLARVQTHLSIRNLTKKLQVQNEQLHQEVTERNQLASELERRVEERTEELSQTNCRLQQEIEERYLAEQTLQRSLVKLQQAQSQLIQSEKMSAIGQMVAGVAHEINNPVNFIYGNLSHVSDYIEDLIGMLRSYQEVYPEAEPKIAEAADDIDLEFLIEDLPKMLSSMQVGAERIREIVLSLRRFSHQDGFEMKPMNIHEGIDSTLMILHSRLKFKQDRPAIEIIKEYSPNFPLVECYGGEMNQVFMNILANAIDAIDECNQHRSAEQIKAYPSCIRIYTQVMEGNRAIIRIKDNGSGIAPDVTQHIFDPFYTTKAPGKGTGIGLSISWQIVVEKHGGSLQCISTPAQGTEFVIELPISQAYQAMIAS